MTAAGRGIAIATNASHTRAWAHHCALLIALPIIALLLSPDAAAQLRDPASGAAVIGGARTEPSVFRLRFERNVNTFGWEAGGRSTVGDSVWDASAAELFRRSLVRTDRDNIRDEQNFEAALTRRISSTLRARGLFSSFIFSDNREIGINDLSNTKIHAGLVWRPFTNLVLYPAAGYGFDKQLGVLDRGVILLGQALLDTMQLGSSMLSADGYSLNEYLQPRFQQDQRVSADMVTAFTATDVNIARVQYRMASKDVYLDPSAGDNERRFETRADEILSVSDQLRFMVSDALELMAMVDVSQRTVSRSRSAPEPAGGDVVFDSDIGEFRLNGALGAQYRPGPDTRGEFRAEWNEREETHTLVRPADVDADIFLRMEKLEEQKNSVIAQFQLSALLEQTLSDRDTITVLGSGVRMQYDTPSPLNVDDRDEVFFVAGVRWAHRYSDVLTSSLTADANLRHTVYIHGARSANNTWNRVFRVSPSMLYASPRFLMRLTSEVLANYTVYDFASMPQSPGSFFLRQLLINDSTTLWLGAHLALDAQLQVRFYERGALNWDAFTINPAAFFDERTLAVTLRAVAGTVTASAGYRIFQQRRYKDDGDATVLEGTLTTSGPVARLGIGDPLGTGVTMEGWYQITTGSGPERIITPNLLIQARWAL